MAHLFFVLLMLLIQNYCVITLPTQFGSMLLNLLLAFNYLVIMVCIWYSSHRKTSEWHKLLYAVGLVLIVLLLVRNNVFNLSFESIVGARFLFEVSLAFGFVFAIVVYKNWKENIAARASKN